MKNILSRIGAVALTSFLSSGALAASSGTVATTAETVRPLLVGQVIPSARVKAIDGKSVDLKELVSKQSAVLVFYRGGWCPYCNVQLKDLKNVEPTLLKLNYQIIAVSADRIEELGKSREKHQVNYALFSDSTMEAAKAFGLAFKVDETTLSKYKGFGIDLEKASGESHHILPVPAVFIVGHDGEIKFQYVNPNYKVRLNGDILIAAAKVYAGK